MDNFRVTSSTAVGCSSDEVCLDKTGRDLSPPNRFGRHITKIMKTNDLAPQASGNARHGDDYGYDSLLDDLPAPQLNKAK
jgi:hypothetical protein